MNSLKNSEGKIPELANQIIMTDEENVNLSQFRTEPIYDMYSDNDNLNKNRKTGIFSGTWNVFTIDTKYSGIRVYACLANKHTVFDCDLDLIKNGAVSEVTATGIAKNQNTSGNNAYMLYGCNITISSNLGFTVREIFAYNGIANAYSSYTSSDTTYFVYKVEGILKEPSMIYTGDELHEGNGIKIENGVISSSPSIITIHLPVEQTISAKTQISPTMTEVVKVGDKLNFVNNEIVIGDGVSVIKASSKAFYIPYSASSVYCYIIKNGDNLTVDTNYTASSASMNIGTSNILIPVTAGDRIGIGFYSSSAGTLMGDKYRTYLTVEVVKWYLIKL